jgi:Rod binding domain-containing protein
MDGINPIVDCGLRIADYGGAKPPSAIADLQSQRVDRSDEQKKQVAKDFESVLLTKLFDQVQESLGRWDLEEDGTSSQVQGLFWFCLARDVADKGGLGLWKEIYQQLPTMGGTPEPGGCLGRGVVTMVSPTVENKVAVLLEVLEADVRHLESALARLDLLRSLLIRRENAALEQLLSEIHQQADAYRAIEQKRQQLRQDLALDLGCTEGELTLSRLRKELTAPTCSEAARCAAAVVTGTHALLV